MTPHRKLFDDYVQRAFGQVRLGDNKPCKIIGMGKILVKQHNGNHWPLKKVRHFRELNKNLISTGQLRNEGYVTTFTNKT